MDAKIIALSCPSCGNACDIQGKDARFGLHITCGYCHTQSLLVINQQLYIPKPQEHVCLKCGCVARPGARFCQCKSLLLKTCCNCRSEFPVDDVVCNQCGFSDDDQNALEQRRAQELNALMDCVDAEIEEEKRKVKGANKRT
jgi:hypothetical protein